MYRIPRETTVLELVLNFSKIVDYLLFLTAEGAQQNYSNFDLEHIITPLNVDLYEELLIKSGFDPQERAFLVDGFRNGFDIGYNGPTDRQDTSKNIPFSVGDKEDMWGKIMKEVKAKRYAGPFENIPFKNYIQSPIGLVPKSGNRTCLIFHLSFNFGENNQSVNACTPREDCTVHYNDLDTAIMNCLKVSKLALQTNGSQEVFLGKTDLSMAFRVLPMKVTCFCWLVLAAVDPTDGKLKYFIDKCLPFGTSISCLHYQRFSNSLRHVMEFKTGCKTITNYLDDFLFAAITRMICNYVIREFMSLCNSLNIPIAEEKTEWGTTIIIFLGILFNGSRLLLSIPIEKQEKALRLLNDVTGKKKITVKQLQVLTWYLNFLTKAIHPGRTFTRRMYAKYSGAHGKLKQHHHVTIDKEFRFDCEIWRVFLTHHSERALCRPMIDLYSSKDAKQLNFFSDASAGPELGFRAYYNGKWLAKQWEPGYIKQKDGPSIEYLELYSLVAAVLTWGDSLQNQRIVIFCDNQAVVAMINNSASSCKKCMYLLRLLILDNLVFNWRVFAKYIRSKSNDLADSLSRLQFDRFWQLAQKRPEFVQRQATPISDQVWPASKIWNI